jgi:hypothetical protein
MRLAFRVRAIGGDERAARARRDFARFEPDAIGVNGLRGDRQHGRCETAAERRLDEGAAIERNVRDKTVDIWLQHTALLD